MRSNKKLGELLIEAGIIDELQLSSALSYQKEWGGKIGSALIKKGFVSEKDILSVLEKQLGMQSVAIAEIERPGDEVLSMVSVDIAKKYSIMPIRLEGRTLVVASIDPTDLKVLDEVSLLIKRRIKPLLALESEITKAIKMYYEGDFTPERQRIAVQASKQLSVEGERFIDPGRITSDPQIVKKSVSDIFPEHELLIEPEKIGRSFPDFEQPRTTQKPKQEISQKLVLEIIIDLLVEKKIFTMEEFIQKIKSRGLS